RDRWLVVAVAAAILCLEPAATAAAPASPWDSWEWEFDQRAYPLGFIPEGARLRAMQEIARSKAALAPAVPGLRAGRWVNIRPAPIAFENVCGPFPPCLFQATRPMNGRVAAIAVDPANRCHLLIGAAR